MLTFEPNPFHVRDSIGPNPLNNFFAQRDLYVENRTIRMETKVHLSKPATYSISLTKEEAEMLASKIVEWLPSMVDNWEDFEGDSAQMVFELVKDGIIFRFIVNHWGTDFILSMRREDEKYGHGSVVVTQEMGKALSQELVN